MWSAVAKAAPPPTVAESDTHIPEGRTRIAVVDANAIISGLRLQGFADKYYTIAEVLNEIRDKQARAFLSTLPYGIEVREPSEESVKAVLRFARATGDLQTLSSADIKLVALAHSLELAAHGAIHIRDEPTRPRLRAKHRTRGKGLPGWGSVPNPEDWRVIDEMEDEGTGAGAGKSRIVGGVQSLIQDGSEEQISYPSTSSSTAATATTTTATASQPAAAAAAVQQQQPLAQAAQEAAASEPATEAQAPAVVAVPAAVVFDAPPGSDDDSDDEDGADDEWQTVGKSKMAARRAKRKAERIAVWEIRRLTQLQQQREAEAQLAAPANIPVASAAAAAPATKAAPRGWGSAAPAATAAAGVTTLVDAVRELCVGESSANDKAGSSAGAEPESASRASSAPGSGQASHQTQQQQQQQGEEGGAGESEQEGDEDESEGDDEGEEGEYSEGSSGLEEGEEYDEEDGEGSDEDGDGSSSVAPSMAAGTSAATQQEEPLPNTDSSIISVTADFAMQNVLLQMGLRLVTPDGRQISRLTRWALRCSACFFVTKEAGRLFCPRCGNMTMDRVELTVGPDGAECFGVKKKHILRGTKYSLPKPRGGRSTAEPILREDVMMLKMKKKMKKKAVGADGEAIDPFAPEFTSDAWFKGQQIANNKGAAAVLAGWKHNPNERKNISRSSRRK